jgi:hypothetical protein
MWSTELTILTERNVEIGAVLEERREDGNGRRWTSDGYRL